jgi:hypothetical protein
MLTPDELRAPIAAGRVKLEAAIRAASENWNSSIGDDDWSPKAAAEHVIPAEAFFASAVCDACGYPGIEMERSSYESADAALTALAAVSELSEGRLKYITPEDLENKHERLGSVVDILQQNAHHLVEHAEQIEAAAKS